MSMKIVLLIRRLRARPDGAASPRVLGICDQAALAAALTVARALPGASVGVLAAGGPGEDEALRHALAAGADTATRVDDPALATVDYQGIGRALAAAIRHLGADLLVCGDRSEDEAQGAVGPAVAEALGVPHLTGARDLGVDGGAIVLTRREAGVMRTLKLTPPALVAVAGQAAPAPAPAAGKTGSGITVLELSALGLQGAELRHREGLLGRAHPVRVARNATLVAEPAELVSRLREDHLLG
jgi:electron transfer flavoprotein beta subunit